MGLGAGIGLGVGIRLGVGIGLGVGVGLVRWLIKTTQVAHDDYWDGS